MLDAASVYCLSTRTGDGLDHADYEAIFEASVSDRDSRLYWEAAARVLNDIFQRDGEVHAAQLRYVAKVYPERVTVEEAGDAWQSVTPESCQGWSKAAFAVTAAADDDSQRHVASRRLPGCP